MQDKVSLADGAGGGSSGGSAGSVTGGSTDAVSTPLLGSAATDTVKVQIVPETKNAAAVEEDELEIRHEEYDEDDLAIRLNGAYKHYGSGKKKTDVLVGLDMSVPRGKIYGLLGPSGCGKTTLLKCIVGKLGLDGGSVLVFGEPPGTRGNGVPGARVGYMPQELALFGEFNIEETLTYFRRIFGACT